jgi:hypothetical protein
MIFGTEEFNDRLLDIIKGGARHSCYKESVDHAEVMSWHFYGITPDKLLSRARPNEDPEITSYRIANYEPHTKSAADKSVNITSKIFNPNLYSIRWAKEKESGNSIKLRDYTLDYFPKYNSLVSFSKDVLLRKMLADPNAVVAVRPDMVESQTETIEPEVIIYGSPNVWDYDYEHYLIFIKCAHINKLEYYTFEYYDNTQFITFDVAVKNLGKTFQLVWGEETRYEYGFTVEEPPAWQLQGLVEAKDDGATVYKSFFHSAVPFWNDAITHESDLKGSFIRHLFPQKYEVAEQCKFRYPYEGMAYPCQGGKIKYGKANETKSSIIDCPHCKGSGFEPIGPYGVYRIQKEKLTDTAPLGIDPVGYINVPVDATKMLDERVDKLMKKGMWAINMDVEDEVGAVQSGAAKVIDRSAQYDMLYTIGSVVFDVHLQNMFYYINKFMFGVESQSLGKKDDENLPQINKPTMFDILSTAELVNNYKVGKDSGMDTNFLVTKQQEILSKDLTTNPDLKAFQMLLLDLDPLAGMADMTIKTNVMSGFTAKKDAVIHFNIRPFVERAIRDNSIFTTLDKSKKIEILDGYAKEFIAQNKVTLDPNIPAF